MKNAQLLTLLLSLTVTVLMTESCKKKKDCPTINCNTGAQNPGTCDCDCPDGYLGVNCETIDLSKIQALLTGGKKPVELFKAGIPLDSLYGKLYGGGLLFSLNTANGTVLIATTADQSNSIEWGGSGTNITALPDIASASAAIMDFNGEANTASIVAQLGDNGGTYYAAKRCADLVANGYNDWYLPAAGELNEMYKKLGPINEGGTGQITTGFYWSSSELNGVYAWDQNFGDGGQDGFNKDGDGDQCRCVRR